MVKYRDPRLGCRCRVTIWGKSGGAFMRFTVATVYGGLKAARTLPSASATRTAPKSTTPPPRSKKPAREVSVSHS